MGDRPEVSKYRRALRNSVSAEARAYGFSLVVLTTGYLCVDEHKLPGQLGALSFLAGALLAEVIVAIGAFREFGATWSTGEQVEYRAYASVRVLSVVAGVFAGWGIATVVHGHDLAYFLSALVAVTVYELTMAGELALALRRTGD